MWQLPERVMNSIGVEKGMNVADIGAGYGYMTFRLARRVGPEGRVYANEIDERFTRRLDERCKDEGVANVTVILGAETDPRLPGKTMDLVLMVNVIHLVDEPVDFLRRIQPSLKPGGKLVIVQWDASKMDVEADLSPEDEIIYAQEAVLKQVESAGYEVERIETFLPVQNIFVCKSIR
jgi:ubiquinone/menaquinone biosynthesis C-methylase UbiE